MMLKSSYLSSSFNLKWVDDLGIITNFTEESFLATKLKEEEKAEIT